MSSDKSQINNTWQEFYYQERKWFHETYNAHDTLLITVGDSWTWGQHLGKINPENSILDDYEHRVKNVYGAHLSNLLKSDWVNIGICGVSTISIMLTAKRFLHGISTPYKKIDIIITLPELCRELTTGFLDKKEEYELLKGDSWPSYDAVVSGTDIEHVLLECFSNNMYIGYDLELYYRIKDAKSLDEFFLNYENYILELANRFFNNPIVVGAYTRFTNLNETIWADVIAKNGLSYPYPANVKLVYYGIDGLDKFSKNIKNIKKQQLLEVLESVEHATTWFKQSKYNAISGHPLEQAHYWWAEYLYNTYKDLL